MTNFKHLTQFELSAYHNGSLERAVRHEIGQHLLTCRECRKQLPLPSVEKFWSAIMTENEPDENSAEEKSKISIGTVLPSFWNLPSNLVWSGGALIVLFALSLIIWLGSVGQSNSERDVAEVFDSEVYIKPPDKVREQVISLQNTLTSEKESSPQPVTSNKNFDKNRTFSPLSPRKKGSESSSRKDIGTNSETKTPGENKKIISATRGAENEKCGEEAAFLMETETKNETVQLRWKKIPNAAKYHLYVSDDEEILVDEYETERETVYVLKKPLDSVKTYKWKVVITLENGQMIIGDAQKFTVKNLRSEQENSKRTKKSQTRCLASN